MTATEENFVVTTRGMMQGDLDDIRNRRLVITLDGKDVSAERRDTLIAHIEHANKVLREAEEARRS